MRMKCEVMVREVMPLARAAIARNLIEGYGMSQTEAAKRMGISQPAISQYKQELRGRGKSPIARDPGFRRLAGDIARRLAEGSLKAGQLEGEMCGFCRLAAK